MKPVRLNRKLWLDTPNHVSDGAGGFIESWVPLGEHWAEVRAGMGREQNREFAVVSAVHYRVIVRASPYGAASRPRADQRFREGARIFRIVAVSEYDPAGRFLICHAYEETAT